MIPSHMTYAVTTHRHRERLDTATRIREIRDAKRDGILTVDRPAQRRLTTARLAAMLTAVKSSLHL